MGRGEGKLIDARRQAVTCSASTCSTHVTKDCIQWLGEIDASLPTVVFTATDPAGAETTVVRVTIDGQTVVEKLDGKAIPLDPGEHMVRFEMEGAEPFEQKFLIRQGEKNRTLTATFRRLPPPAPPMAPPPNASTGVPIWAWVSGGIGVSALAVGAGFGIAGLMAQSDLVDKCGGDPARCPVSTKAVTVPPAERRTLDRNVFIGLEAVALVGLVVSIVGIAKAPSKTSTPGTSLLLTPFGAPQGGGLAAYGSF